MADRIKELAEAKKELRRVTRESQDAHYALGLWRQRQRELQAAQERLALGSPLPWGSAAQRETAAYL